jgi:hypothetical protein
MHTWQVVLGADSAMTTNSKEATQKAVVHMHWLPHAWRLGAYLPDHAAVLCTTPPISKTSGTTLQHQLIAQTTKRTQDAQ